VGGSLIYLLRLTVYCVRGVGQENLCSRSAKLFLIIAQQKQQVILLAER